MSTDDKSDALPCTIRATGALRDSAPGSFVYVGHGTCVPSEAIEPDPHPAPWRWLDIPAGCYGMADARGMPVLRVTPAAVIEFASPVVRVQTEAAPELEALLLEGRDDDVPAKACAVQPGAVHQGLTAEACGTCWYCRVDAVLAKIDEARRKP